MANANATEVSAHALSAGFGPALQKIYGDDVVKSPTEIFNGVTEALEAYEQDPLTFYPYASRYDAYLNGLEKLTPAEQRGLTAFNDPARGNCAICHKSGLFQDGGHPDFTDFGMIALGAPATPKSPGTATPISSISASAALNARTSPPTPPSAEPSAPLPCATSP